MSDYVTLCTQTALRRNRGWDLEAYSDSVPMMLWKVRHLNFSELQVHGSFEDAHRLVDLFYYLFPVTDLHTFMELLCKYHRRPVTV